MDEKKYKIEQIKEDMESSVKTAGGMVPVVIAYTALTALLFKYGLEKYADGKTMLGVLSMIMGTSFAVGDGFGILFIKDMIEEYVKSKSELNNLNK